MASGSSSPQYRATPGPSQRLPDPGTRRRAGGDGRRQAMNTEPINHATFIVVMVPTRRMPRASFRAFSDTDVKRRWFAEARAGGSKSSPLTSGRPATDEPLSLCRWSADHQRHPLPGHRHRRTPRVLLRDDDRRPPNSASLASVELFPAQGGTCLVYTRAGAVLLDGGEQALQRKIGCGELYDTLGEELASAS